MPKRKLNWKHYFNQRLNGTWNRHICNVVGLKRWTAIKRRHSTNRIYLQHFWITSAFFHSLSSCKSSPILKRYLPESRWLFISCSYRYCENYLKKSFQIGPMLAPSKEHIRHTIILQILQQNPSKTQVCERTCRRCFCFRFRMRELSLKNEPREGRPRGRYSDPPECNVYS